MAMRTIAYLGNSVTAQKASFVEPLHQLLNTSWGLEGEPVRAGLGGVGSLAMAGLLDYLVLRHSPRICFVECSLADAGGATPMPRVALGVESILGDLTHAGITPVILHLPRTDIPADVHQSVIDIYDDIARTQGVLRIDVRHLADDSGLSDGVHTTPDFAERIAADIHDQLGPEPPLRTAHTPLPTRKHVRLLPASSGRASQGNSRASTYRLSMDTTVLDIGGTLRLQAPGARFLGVYVIARATSGVIGLHSNREVTTVQVWDKWCSRARIQFIHLPERMGSDSDLEIVVTDLLTGDRDALGFAAGLTHRGTSLEIIGAAIQIPVDDEYR